MIPRLARVLAILIAIVAVIDPAVTSTRATRPDVAIVSVDSVRDAQLSGRVARALGEQFTVIPASFPPAAATILIGTRLPASADEISSTTFAVTPARARPSATIEAVGASSRAGLEARVPIAVTVHALGASGRDVELTLSAGTAVVDRVTKRIASDDERMSASLTFIPTATGAAPLRVSARIADAPAAAPAGATADLLIDVRDDRWSVLFFDPRPSWMSTFVRRAVERDPRFAVTSRVVTSRSVSVDAGRPPATLADADALAVFDAVVVGAAQVLTARDVAGLEAFLRRRGGAVILLLDERANGPFDRLTGVRQWGGATDAAGFAIASGDATVSGVTPSDSTVAGLRATSLAWPEGLPSGARELASTRSSGTSRTDPRPVIWRVPVGAGELVVSGALDAWRHRDPAVSRFDEYWRESIADAAAAGANQVEIELSSTILAPGEHAEITATLRTVALDQAATLSPDDSITAWLDVRGDSLRIPLWPDGTPGRFRGSFPAPVAPGTHRITVARADLRADVPLLVSTTAAEPAPDESDLVAAWISSRGGAAFEERSLDDLQTALERTLRPVLRNETWHPMRSAWWIVPFALLLGAEWLARRRGGLA